MQAVFCFVNGLKMTIIITINHLGVNMSVELIKKQLKSGELGRLYMLYGDENYLKTYYCSALAKKAVNGMESFNLHRFDVDNFSLSQLEAAIDNLPLMSDRKCIIMRDIDPEELKADQWKELQQVLKAIPAECVLILHYDAVEYDKSKSKWQTLLGIVQKAGIAAEIGRQPRSNLIKWLVKKATEDGCAISRENAEYLINTCGQDMNLLACETAKLCAFTEDGNIQKSAVDELTAKPLDASIYDLARSVTGGETGRSLKIIDDLFYKKEEPVIILSALSGAFCDLYRAKTAQISGARQDDIKADFNYKGRGFRVEKAMKDSAGIDLSFLSESINLLMQADEAIKSTRIDKRVVLERLVVEIAGTRKRVGHN